MPRGDGSHMPQPQLVGKESIFGRQLFHLRVESVADLPPRLSLPSRHFALLLAWDAQRVTDETIRQLARWLMNEGLAYLCAWGPDCERVHDQFDLAFVGEKQVEADESFIVTTWHDDEPLREALWEFLYCTLPADDYLESCNSGLVISVGNDEWSRLIVAALSDPAAFSDEVLEDETES